MKDEQTDRVDHLLRCDQMMKDSRNAALTGIAALAGTVALLDLSPAEITDFLPVWLLFSHALLIGIITGASFSGRQSLLSTVKKPTLGDEIERNTVEWWTKRSRQVSLLSELSLGLSGAEIVQILFQGRLF